MTWPRGEGAVDRPSKSMGESPQGWTPYSILMSFIRWRGIPIAIWEKTVVLGQRKILILHWSKPHWYSPVHWLWMYMFWIDYIDFLWHPYLNVVNIVSVQFSRQLINNILLTDCPIIAWKKTPQRPVPECGTPTAAPNQLGYTAFLAALPFSLTAADLFTHNPKQCRTDHVTYCRYNHWNPTTLYLHAVSFFYGWFPWRQGALASSERWRRWSVLTLSALGRSSVLFLAVLAAAWVRQTCSWAAGKLTSATISVQGCSTCRRGLSSRK